MTAPEPDGIVWHTSSYSGNGEACVEVGWHTSSYSAGNGDCVEVGWHTSSYSGNGDACVEVGWRTSGDESGAAPDRVLVRDSKDRTGPALTFSAAAWRAFLTTLTR